MSTSYIIHELPHNSARLELVIDRYITFRLSAGNNERTLVKSNYEFTLSRLGWMNRLSKLDLHIFIASEHRLGDNENTLANGEWVGMYYIRGPLNVNDVPLIAIKSPNLGPCQQEMDFALGTLYITPSHRRSGLVKTLHQSILDNIRGFASAPHVKSARILGTIPDPSTSKLKGFYLLLGGESVGQCTLEDCQVLAGVPEAVLRIEKGHERVEIIREVIVCGVDCDLFINQDRSSQVHSIPKVQVASKSRI